MKTPHRAIQVRSVVAIVFVVVIVAAVIGGIALLDSPAQERLRRLDERRVDDLHQLAYGVDIYWTREGSLPASLADLSEEERIARDLADPATGQAYEYRVLGDKTFELCAVFARDTGTDGRDTPLRSFWLHGPGRQCFQLEAQDIGRVVDR
ncbi:hypothetical protein ACFLSF_01780 [Candidatus Bipolaricaulota bacterium]